MLKLSFVCLAFAAFAFGQSLQVEVRDSSGGAIAGAAVLVESTSTAARFAARTDSSGNYRLDRIPSGLYRVRVSRDGFAAYTGETRVNSASATLSVRLEVGAPAYAVSVVSATPLAGLDRPVAEIPSPIQAATDRDIESSGALDVSDFLNRRMNNVFVNEIQGNPLQPDVNYRGYSASPLLGTPQGISLYLDGVRLNEPFGDAVSWDLIPRIAISDLALVPGSNPLFGLNTLGGALSMRTKDGLADGGTSLEIGGGSFGRKTASFEHGGANRHGFHWYGAGNFLFEDGWRVSSPTNARQFFLKTGLQRERTSISLGLSFSNNALIGNGLQEQRFLERDYASVYTKPDQTLHKAPMLNLQIRRSLTSRLSLAANGYFRYIRTRTLNGDINEESLDQSVYQPGAAERAALAAAGYTGVPAAGATAANTPFPFWRCIGNALIRDEPSEKCNGLLNRSQTHQRNYGFASQLTWYATNHQLTVGGAYDGNRVGFDQSTELGYLNPDRSVTGVAAFGDGITGGNADGEPYDTRVQLSGRILSGSFFATDTITAGSRTAITLSGRFNRTVIDNRDVIRPRAGTGSLTGRHTFHRFNPAAGITHRLGQGISLYGGYQEGNRAPTSIELGCADPEAPCKLPNAMAGDPPLQLVVTRTLEAGLRGTHAEGQARWSFGWFRSATRDDILFVASEQTGFGYFKNFERTRRQGLEASFDGRMGRVSLGAGYTFLNATFQSTEELNGTGNSTNEEAQEGLPGMEAAIRVRAGNRIPLTPRHLTKVHVDWQALSRLRLNFGVIGTSRSFARGNENNAHQPDGRYYLGPGYSPGYAIATAGARLRLHTHAEIFLQANNLFNRRYYTAAQLGPTGFTATGNYIARPFPANSEGEFPVLQATFYAPGAPRAAWAGLRVRF